jgi:uncharacterized integral membrane protein
MGVQLSHSGIDDIALQVPAHTGLPQGDAMSVVHPNPDIPADPAVPAAATPPADPAAATPPGDPAGPPASSPSGSVPHTRTSAAWFAICATAAASVVLIIFMLQNTRSVVVTFLWMQGSVPLALALLIAAVGAAVVAMAVGGARIGQLRRLARRQK